MERKEGIGFLELSSFFGGKNDPRTSTSIEEGQVRPRPAASGPPPSWPLSSFTASTPLLPHSAAFIPGKLRSPRPRASSKVHVKVAATFRAARTPEHRRSAIAAFLTAIAARITVNVAPLIDRAGGTCANANGSNGGDAEKSSRAFSNEHLLPFLSFPPSMTAFIRLRASSRRRLDSDLHLECKNSR